MKRGTRIANAYIATTVDGDSINEGIVDALDDPSIGRAAEDSGEESGERWNKGFGKKFEGLRGKIGARLNREMGDAGEEAGEVAGDRAGDSLGRRLSAKAKDVADRVSQELGDRLASNPEQVRRGIDRAFDDDFAVRIGDRLGASIVGGFEQRLARIGDGEGDSNPLADLFDRLMDDATSPNRRGGKKKKGFDIGALFGAGSRNNALNLFGKTIGGITKAVSGLASMGQRLGAAFMEGFSSLEEGASFAQKGMAGLSKAGAEGGAAISSLGAAAAAAGPAIAAAIIVVIAVASTLVSVLGALLGLATALTATIVGGLTGAVIALGGAFAATAAAGGLLVLAFMSMTDTQKKLLTDAFQPLHEAVVGIGQLMLNEMVPAFQTWANNLRGALMLVVPVAQVMGKAFADAGNTITAALSGPGFQLLSQAFAVYLPGIVRNLAVAFGALFNGLAATLAALMPTITRFSGYLAQVALRFANWASSAKGQNAIQDFANRAVAALKSLWGATREIMGFIVELLFNPAVQAQGASMFDTLRDAFAKFRVAIQDGRLEKWMKDAAKFGSALWATLGAIGRIFEALYNSGVIDAVSNALRLFAFYLDSAAIFLGPLITSMVGPATAAFQAILSPIDTVTAALITVREAAQEAWYWIGKAAAATPLGQIPGLGKVFGSGGNMGDVTSAWDKINKKPQTVVPAGAPIQKKTKNAFDALNLKLPSWEELMGSGHDSLLDTSTDAGGYKPPAEYKNPYVAWANSLIKNGPSDAAEIKKALAKSNRLMLKAFRDANSEMVKALKEENKIAAKAIKDAVAADSVEGATTALTDAITAIGDKAKDTIKAIKESAKSVADGLRESAKSAVDNAQGTLNSAAQSLASASSPEAAATALAAVRKAQATVANAERAQTTIGRRADRIVARAAKEAAKLKRRTARANRILSNQRVQNNERALSRIGDDATTENFQKVSKVQNKTLADFAATRAKVATLLESANAKLADAMALRDDYQKQVADSIKAFGALTTVQARVVDGIEQAITADDIVKNLQEKLAKITAFRAKLQQLLALGLSNAAYQQIVDAGVEGGTAYADALLAGGSSAVDQVNELTGGINTIAEEMGTEIASQMYQAGVDAAQGLVDGLESLSAQLDAAATRLGNAIAAAVKKALGIKSPSKVMAGLMDYVGDGTVQGLDAQHTKVGKAAGRFSDQIAVSPEVASYAAIQGQSPLVSGNGPTHDIDVTIITPTEDPMAVAQEAINEITGRL